MATSNKSFLVKNGLSVGGATGIIEVIDSSGNWIGATGSIPGTSNPAWQVVTATANLLVNTKYLADTSNGEFTVTFPASPSIGDSITIGDAEDISAYNLTIDPNGKNISGNAGNLILSTKGIVCNFVYYGGWLRYDFNFAAGEFQIFGDLQTQTGSEDLNTGTGYYDLNN